MLKMISVLLLVAANIFESTAFWSLDTDLQFGYEVYDKSYDVALAISSAATRSNVIQSDDKTRLAVGGLNAIATQLRTSPIVFFNELSIVAASRSNNEAYHISRLRNTFVNYNAALNVLLNSTGPLNALADVSNPNLVAVIRTVLTRVQLESRHILAVAENITKDVTAIRANSSLLLTPELIHNFIDSNNAQQMTSSLATIRNNFLLLLAAVRDTGRLVGAHGSVHELLSRSFSRDTTSRNSALNSFVNNYNRVRNLMLQSVAAYSQAAESSLSNFITRVRLNYDDKIVRPKFEKVQLPIIHAFGNVIVSKVFNLTFFQSSFDNMRDEIVESYTNATNILLSQGSVQRDEILDLQRTLFVRHYSPCLNELVAEAQQSSSAINGQYAFCLNERTSGIVITIPSTTQWLSVIRDNINFILQQLNSCLSGDTSVAGLTSTSDCIQSNANNLPFYATYLPITVESNLKPITEGSPIIFKNCIRSIPTSNSVMFTRIRDECKAEVLPPQPTTTPEPTTTTVETEEATDEGSGYIDIF